MGAAISSSSANQKILEAARQKMSTDQNLNLKTATFALGCFWHSDATFGCQKGVHFTRCGYTSGTLPNPTYRNLGDHTEAVEVDYDPTETNFKTLLNHFWNSHDPTELHKRQYRSAVFYRDSEEQNIACESKKEIEGKIGRSVATAIEAFDKFYNAEDYHQKYFLQTHHKALFKSLGIKQQDLVNSTLAAKLNGYIVGENSLEAFDAECKSLGLTADNIAYIRKEVAKGKQGHC
ncbi:peptide methionine sulfoxide reductase MsrA [Parasteatoda tepidariorum]|nr:peptide methionine sulfoxide reductase MsrA [Parasteatoda tepidariorum]